MNDKIQLKRGTLANWLKADPILLDGEMALVATDASKPTVYDQYKVGGGSKKFSELPYQGLPCLQELGDSTTSPLSQKAITDWINKGYQFRGVATPSTNPGTPDGPVFYLASEAGTYSNFNGISVAVEEVAILEWKGSWIKKTTGFATQRQIVGLEETTGIEHNTYMSDRGMYSDFVNGWYNTKGKFFSEEGKLATKKIKVVPNSIILYSSTNSSIV